MLKMISCYKKIQKKVLPITVSILALAMISGCAGVDFSKLKINLNDEDTVVDYPTQEIQSKDEIEPKKVSEPVKKDPNKMIEYLKNRQISNEEGESDENSSEWDMSKEVIFLSNRGYDTSVSPKGIRFVNGSYELTRVSKDDIPAECKIAYSNLIRDRLEEITSTVKDLDTMDVTMYLADMLLTLEYYSDSPVAGDVEKSSVSQAERILADYSNDKVFKALSDDEKYNVCAVLACCANQLSGNDNLKKDSIGASEDIWSGLKEKDLKQSSSMFWAAAALFSATGETEYEDVCEDIVKDGVPTGFGMNDPGYYGCFAYMHSNFKSDNSVNAEIMERIFADANENIRHSLSELIAETAVSDFSEETQMSLCEEDMKNMDDMINCSRLEMMANYISTSVEYSNYAQDRLNFIYGANHTGCDYSDKENFDNKIADIFTLCALLQTSIK